MKRNIIICGIIAAALIASFILGSYRGRSRAISSLNRQVDTLVIYRPKSGNNAISAKVEFKGFDVTIPKVIYGNFIDTVVQPQVVFVHDTVKLYVPMTQHYFCENDGRLRLWATGYNVSLDRWEIDDVEKVVTPRIKPHSVFLDASGIYDKSPLLPITANYGYEKNGLMLYCGAGYDIFTRSPVLRAGVRWRLMEW